MKHRKEAVALKYNLELDQAPQVVAKGRNELAERIAELAKSHKVPLVENSQLVHSLLELEVNQEIPPELYQAVAEVLAFIYSLDEE